MMNEENKLEKMLGLEKSESDKPVNMLDSEIEKAVDFDIDAFSIGNSVEREVVDEYDDEEDTKPEKKAKKIDLSKLSIVDATELDKDTDLRSAIYGGKSMYQIVAAQSGYMAKLAPLVHKDVVSLLYSNLNRYEYRKSVFKVIYDKIGAISSEKMNFETWLKNTSVEDIETFYYGIYCATFPDEGKFSFVCPKCGQERTMTIPHSNLFKTTDNSKMKKLIKDVSANATTPEARKKYSLVGKTEGYELPDSKIIMEVRTPSLWDSLEILRVVPERVIDRDTSSVTNMLYVKRFLIPSRNGEKAYTEQTNSEELLRIIDNLTIDDAAQLERVVSERVDNHRITYSIKNVKCPTCGETNKEVPISIEDILFSLIFEKAQ